MEQEGYPYDVETATGPDRRPLDTGFSEPNAKFADFLLTDKSIPREMRKTGYWAYGDKEMALSNLDEKSIQRIMNSMQITHLFHLMSKPDYHHSWQDEIDFSQLKAKVFVKLNRSKDGFERRALTTQIRQSIIQEGPQPASGGIGGGVRGFFGKFFGGGKR